MQQQFSINIDIDQLFIWICRPNSCLLPSYNFIGNFSLEQDQHNQKDTPVKGAGSV